MSSLQKLIVLYGHSNCGKSDSLNRLKELLRLSGVSTSKTPHPNSDDPETFMYKGLLVCVAPAGDTGDIVKRNTRYFNAKKCNVAFSASRTKGGTVDVINQYAEDQGVEVDWVQKSYEYSLDKPAEDFCNQETARLLLEMI